MVHQPLDRARTQEAFERLDALMRRRARLVIGGGAAMVLAYDHPLATQDVDAFAAQGGLRMSELDQMAKQVAAALDIEPDWLNAHFETFTAVLPSDYPTRLRPVYRGEHLEVDALSPEDLLVMKCFAARDKDRPHARRLIHLADDLGIVSDHLSKLIDRNYPKAEQAADFFDDLMDEEGF
jgi:hypothetical protein